MLEFNIVYKMYKKMPEIALKKMISITFMLKHKYLNVLNKRRVNLIFMN
jgi:hypothetical protein